MFLSMNWICDFVDLSGLDRKSLIKNFTLSTAEVEDIIVKGEDTYGVVVAEIVSIENHPNSKKLSHRQLWSDNVFSYGFICAYPL